MLQQLQVTMLSTLILTEFDGDSGYFRSFLFFGPEYEFNELPECCGAQWVTCARAA